MNDFLNSVCSIHLCKPLSQTLLMAIYHNQEIDVPPDMLLKLWTTWQNDYAVHVTDDQKTVWEEFFQKYVPLPQSIMDLTIRFPPREHATAIKDVLSSLHWDSHVIANDILAGRNVTPERLLNTTWTLSLAKLVVQKICFIDTIGYFQGRFNHSATNLNWMHKKLAAFPQKKPMKNKDHVDWFFLRTLLCRHRSAGPVLWAGGSVQQLHDEDYTRETVYDAFEKENIDIDVFYAEPKDITEWLMELQDCHLCSVVLSENKKYATIQCLKDRSVHFKVNLIFFQPQTGGAPSAIEFSMKVLNDFDMPPCQQGIVWDASTKSFIHLSSLACSMIDKENTVIFYNHDMNPNLMARMEKYLKRGFLLTRTDNKTAYGILSRLVDYEHHEPEDSFFVDIHAMYDTTCLPLLFREEDERKARELQERPME